MNNMYWIFDEQDRPIGQIEVWMDSQFPKPTPPTPVEAEEGE